MGAANLIDANAAKRYSAVPVAFLDEATLLVAMADPANILAIDDIAMMTRYDVHRAVATKEDVAAVISTSTGSSITSESRRTSRRRRHRPR